MRKKFGWKVHMCHYTVLFLTVCFQNGGLFLAHFYGGLVLALYPLTFLFWEISFTLISVLDKYNHF